MAIVIDFLRTLSVIAETARRKEARNASRLLESNGHARQRSFQAIKPSESHALDYFAGRENFEADAVASQVTPRVAARAWDAYREAVAELEHELGPTAAVKPRWGGAHNDARTLAITLDGKKVLGTLSLFCGCEARAKEALKRELARLVREAAMALAPKPR